MKIKPILELSQDKMFFEPTVKDSYSDVQYLVLTNSGFVDILIGSISLSGDFNTEGSTPEVLKPGQTHQLPIVFAPSAVGTRIGAVHIELAEGTGKHYVSLFGSGVLSGIDDIPSNQVGIPIFLTRAELEEEANLVYQDGRYALVINDPELTNIGFYKKNGDSGEGEWGDPIAQLNFVLPSPFVELANSILVLTEMYNAINDRVIALET